MYKQRIATSTIHKHLVQLQRAAMSLLDNSLGKKGVDNLPLLLYEPLCMSTSLAQQIKCKHCDKTFPTQEAFQGHMKKVNAGLRGGYRKHRAPQRYTLTAQDTPRGKGTPTALDRLAEIRGRKEQLLDAMSQITEDERLAMEAVQQEYDEQSKRLAALSTELTVQRRTQIAVREELEAHKPAPEG